MATTTRTTRIWDITVDQNARKEWTVTWDDEAGPIDITGGLLIWQIKSSHDGDVLIDARSNETTGSYIDITDAVNGEFEIILVGDDTVNLDPRDTYYHDILFIPNGATDGVYLFKGEFKISPTGSRNV